MLKNTPKDDKAIRRMPVIFPIMMSEDMMDEDGAYVPSTIQIIPVGQWNHPAYGMMTITPDDIREFSDNFNKGIRKGVPITEGHEVMDEKPAVGWIQNVDDRGNDGLWADVDWTDSGQQMLSEKKYKYFSPEFYREYEDPETRQVTSNVLTGGALTNKPYFKQLQAIVLSEGIINKNNDMNIQEIIAKDKATLTADEKAFIKANVNLLDDEGKAAYADILTDAPATPEVKPEVPAEPVPETPATPAEVPAEVPAVVPEVVPETPADPATQVNASEPVAITAGELFALRKAANEGKQAFSELRKMKLGADVKALVFNDKTNVAGKFLPKSEPKIMAFMETLSEAQVATFKSLVAELPKATEKLFSEDGTSAPVENAEDAVKAVELKAEALIKENKDMKYSDAIKKVFAEDPKLQERYVAQVGGQLITA